MVMFIQPSDSDILLGRTKTSFNHPGNINFRILINDSVRQYAISPTRKDKVVLIKGLLDSFIYQHGCRFLKQFGTQWVDVSDQPIARDKISHAVRDALTTHSKRGIYRNTQVDSTVHQQPFPNRRKTKKSVKEKFFSKTKATVMISRMIAWKKLPCHGRDDDTDKIEEDLYQTSILEKNKKVQEYCQDRFSPSCNVSKNTGRECEASRLISSFFDAAANSSSSCDRLVPTSTGGILSISKDVEHDSSDITMETLDSLENELKRFYEQQGPSWQSMQNLFEDPLDMRVDGERYHMDACEMWEDDVAIPLRSSKFIEGVQSWFLSEIDGGEFIQ